MSWEKKEAHLGLVGGRDPFLLVAIIRKCSARK